MYISYYNSEAIILHIFFIIHIIYYYALFYLSLIIYSLLVFILNYYECYSKLISLLQLTYGTK